MSEEQRANADERAPEAIASEEQAQHASDNLKDQIAALRSRVKTAQKTLSEHVGREDRKIPKS